MTTISITPYLNFDGNCREAMTFYQSILGGELDLKTFAGTPMEDTLPDSHKEKIMHSTLILNGTTLLMASDATNLDKTGHTNVSLSINFNSEDAIDSAFDKLSVDGVVKIPLAKQFWGAKFGQFIDKFNVSWMLHFDNSQQLAAEDEPSSKKPKTKFKEAKSYIF